MSLCRRLLCIVFAGPFSFALSTAATLTPGSLVTASAPDSPVSASDPTCTELPQFGYLQRQSEVEPSVAINPVNPLNMIASWQQDRWENGAAQETSIAYSTDGGATWTNTTVPYQRCLGGPFRRVSDPWVTFSPNGTAYQMVLYLNRDADVASEQTGMAVSRSEDGGVTWSSPRILASEPGLQNQFFHDKNSVTADPTDSAYVYAIWDNIGLVKGPAWFTRTTDGGATWQKAHQIYNVNKDLNSNFAATIGNIIQVLPNGDLLGMMVRYWPKKNANTATLSFTNDDTNFDIAVIRSRNHGRTWAPRAVRVASFLDTGNIPDPEPSGWSLRTGDVIPSIAVNRTNGNVYVVWQALPTLSGQSTIYLSVSRDGGLTWSSPQTVNQVTSVPAFTPVVAVTDSGYVAVSYYDFRNDDDNDEVIGTDAWLSVFSDNGSAVTFEGETRLTDVTFDMRHATWAGGLFLGDYEGLASAGDTVTAVFGITTPGSWEWNYVQSASNPNVWVSDQNRTDMVSRNVTITP